MKIMTIFGTRPEAIKLAPIIIKLQESESIQSKICITAQHREMLDQTLGIFGITPDIDLNLMKQRQSLADITARVLNKVDQVLMEEKPNLILIQGDTTTVMASSLAAFYRHISIGHVEAGLRSGNPISPFPEEMNRRVTSIVAQLHFAPTQRAFQTLLNEGVPKERVYMTGNPVIDALHIITQQPAPLPAKKILDLTRANGKGDNPKLILVTAHRRENFGQGLEEICYALKRIVKYNPEVIIVYPVHLNPNVQEPVNRLLGETDRILLTDPLPYDVLAHVMKAAYLVLTDSGGIQEEAPSLGKPVLVLRKETERPEGIEAGTAKLINPSKEVIVEETQCLLNDSKAYAKMARTINPYGDGHSADLIVDIILRRLKI